MKLKLGKKQNKYYAGIYTGSGGVSSMVNYKENKKLLQVLSVFKLKNLWVGLFGKKKL